MPITLFLENQFGEQSNNVVEGGNMVGAVPQATLTLLGNLTASSALPIPVTTQAVANKLPAKAGVQSINALTGSETLAQTITQVNAILAALKVVS